MSKSAQTTGARRNAGSFTSSGPETVEVAVYQQGYTAVVHEERAGLSSTPSLTMSPAAKAGGRYLLRLLYEAGGLGWAARYS